MVTLLFCFLGVFCCVSGFNITTEGQLKVVSDLWSVFKSEIIGNYYLSDDLDLSNWMYQKKDSLWNKTLSELTILGTHDSGAYNLTKYLLPGSEPLALEALIKLGEELGIPVWYIVNLWSLAQPSNLYNQMLYGIRYFDLRCGWLNKHKQWVTFHGNYGQSINKLINDINNFLLTHTGEIVLIEASHLDGNPNEIQKQWLINNFTFVFNDLLFPFNNNYSYPTYGEMIDSNRRVLLSLSDSLANNYNTIWPGNTFENSYADSDNITKMISYNNNQVYKFNNGLTNNNSLFKISWTLTPHADVILKSPKPGNPKSLIQLANIANSQMWNWTQTQFNNNLRIGNVFIFDNYINASIEQIINALY